MATNAAFLFDSRNPVHSIRSEELVHDLTTRNRQAALRRNNRI